MNREILYYIAPIHEKCNFMAMSAQGGYVAIHKSEIFKNFLMYQKLIFTTKKEAEAFIEKRFDPIKYIAEPFVNNGSIKIRKTISMIDGHCDQSFS